MKTDEKKPILMLGMDAAEVSLIEKFSSEGKLPAIQSLKQKGYFSRLESTAPGFAGGVWPTFYTGRDVPYHGIYHGIIWRQEKMRSEIIDDSWVDVKPFWEYMNPGEVKMAIIDVPLLPKTPRVENGLHISGWQSHDRVIKQSWPRDLWSKLESEFGPPAMPEEREMGGEQTIEKLEKSREQILGSVRQIGDIGGKLFAREHWDLFFLALGAPHRVGHLFWNTSQLDKMGAPEKKLKKIRNTILEVYQACDRVIGDLVDKAPDGTRIMVFANHGMGTNPGWQNYLDQMLEKIAQEEDKESGRKGLLQTVEGFLPTQLVDRAVSRLPLGLRKYLSRIYHSNQYEWENTRFFPLPSDPAGYLRINLKGREKDGIVESEEEYYALCDKLKKDFLGFRDMETNEPIVDDIYHVDDFAPENAPYRHRLPDLIVNWGERSVINSPGIYSEDYGEIALDNDGELPTGRSGNHAGKGWIVASGDEVTKGVSECEPNIMDLAPTIFDWFGLDQREEFQGNPIAHLVEG